MFESSSHPNIGQRPTLPLVRALCGSALFLLVHLPTAGAQSRDHSTDALRKVNESVEALIKKVSPSVVQILVTAYGPLEDGEHGNATAVIGKRSEEHTSELQSRLHLVCRLLLEKKKKKYR